jgi:hypothetical protein
MTSGSPESLTEIRRLIDSKRGLSAKCDLRSGVDLCTWRVLRSNSGPVAGTVKRNQGCFLGRM